MKASIVCLALGALLVALSWPAAAQQPEKVYRIGILAGSAQALGWQPRNEALQQGLRELGYVDGQNRHGDHRRSGRSGAGQQPRATRRQPDRSGLPEPGPHDEATRAVDESFPTPLASEASVGLERQWGRLHPGRIGGADAPASHATARQAGSGPSRGRVQRRHSRPGRSPPGPGVAVPQREPEDRGRPRRPPTPLPATYEAKTFAEIGGLMSHGPSFSDICTAASRRSWTDPERGEASRPSGRAAHEV